MKNEKHILNKNKLPNTAILLFVFVVFSTPLKAAEDYGIDPASREIIDGQARATVAYDVSTNEGALNSPSSIVAMTCFNQTVQTNTTVTGSLFSGGFTKQAADKVIKDDLKNWYDQNFGWDNVVKYDTEIKAELSVTGSISIGAETGGPKVKGVKCDNMNTVWERKRHAGVNSFPTFIEATKSLLLGQSPTTDTGEGSKKFRSTWGNMGDTQEDLISAQERNRELNNRLTDPTLSGRETPCEVVKRLGVAINCRSATR